MKNGCEVVEIIEIFGITDDYDEVDNLDDLECAMRSLRIRVIQRNSTLLTLGL